MKVSFTPPQAAASIAGALLHDQELSPEVAAAEQQLSQLRGERDTFQARLEANEQLLSMGVIRRIRNCNYGEMTSVLWQETARNHALFATAILMPGMIALGVVASNLGYPPTAGFAAAGALWLGYVKGVARHVILPLRVDQLAVKALRSEQSGLKGAVAELAEKVQQAEGNLAALKTDALAKLKTLDIGSTVKVDEAAVTFGGVRIKVRKR